MVKACGEVFYSLLQLLVIAKRSELLTFITGLLKDLRSKATPFLMRYTVHYGYLQQRQLSLPP